METRVMALEAPSISYDILAAQMDLCHEGRLGFGHRDYASDAPLLQKDSPGADKEANWLPAPNDTIYLVMRLYWPKTEAPSILPAGEGTWKPPGIVVAQ
jgi:hypothetical protein